MSSLGILFLQGVFKKDCKRIEDIFHDKLLDKNNKIEEKKVYDKIPVLFTNINTWPKTTNLNCWYCSRNFKNRPWFEPQSIEPATETIIEKTNNYTIYNNKKIVLGVKGIFCSCNCVYSYIMLYCRDISDKLNKIMMLKILYEIFNEGKSIVDIKPAPHFTEMQKFGGNITESEYQRLIESLDSNYEHKHEIDINMIPAEDFDYLDY